MAKTTIITGAASGIGLATARQLHGAGHTIHGWDRDEAGLGAVADELGARFVARAVDVTDPEQVAQAFDVVGAHDVFVAAAGVCRQARLDDENSDQVWRQVLDVNLNGVYYGLKGSAAHIADGGAMVVVSSGLGKNARAAYEAYTASKHGVLGLMKCVALELAPRKVRVNAVCPGWVDTPMSRADVVESARRAQVEPEAFRQRALAGLPLGRMVTPDDVADLITFLASERAAVITGQSYNISAGEFSN